MNECPCGRCEHLTRWATRRSMHGWTALTLSHVATLPIELLHVNLLQSLRCHDEDFVDVLETSTKSKQQFLVGMSMHTTILTL
eukprot:577870-Amphidinium_carterae.1